MDVQITSIKLFTFSYCFFFGGEGGLLELDVYIHHNVSLFDKSIQCAPLLRKHGNPLNYLFILDGDDADKNPDTLKSEISLVHEIALKRNMHISFEVGV